MVITNIRDAQSIRVRQAARWQNRLEYNNNK